MSAAAAFVYGAIVLVFLSLAWGCYWKSRYHKAKSEVYREFADTFASMRPVFRTAKAERRAESKRHYLSLALCDPLVRDGLADALEEAEGHWNRMRSDPPRDWAITRLPAASGGSPRA